MSAQSRRRSVIQSAPVGWRGERPAAISSAVWGLQSRRLPHRGFDINLFAYRTRRRIKKFRNVSQTLRRFVTAPAFSM